MSNEHALASVKEGQLNDAWKAVIGDQLELPYMQALRDFLATEKGAGKVIYPPGAKIFNAFNHTSFEAVKVVVLGQDPYHGPGQAHGLCFSVQPGIKVPPSLLNIYKELNADLGLAVPAHGCLTKWAEQGVLLLNAVLTVEQANAGSHQGKGWERFTDRVVQVLNEQRSSLVFMLWGSYAQKKGQFIDRSRHLVLEAPHPSPLSAHRGFLGCKHFSQANSYLKAQGVSEIDWMID